MVKAAAPGKGNEMMQKIYLKIEGRLTEAGISCRVSGGRTLFSPFYRKMHLKEQRSHWIVDMFLSA
ncbi:hypothetical protein ACNKHL_22155 [Shigella flexneri]